MKSNFIAAICAATLLFAACQKKDTTPVDPSKVNIALMQPYDGQVYHKGDTVFVKSTVTYNTELHGYELSIADSATGTTYYSLDEHIHDDHFDISEYWVDTLSSPATLQFSMTVEIDHDGNEVTKNVFLQAK